MRKKFRHTCKTRHFDLRRNSLGIQRERTVTYSLLPICQFIFIPLMLQRCLCLGRSNTIDRRWIQMGGSGRPQDHGDDSSWSQCKAQAVCEGWRLQRLHHRNIRVHVVVTSTVWVMLQEIKLLFPNSQRINRGNYEIKQLMAACRANNVTDVIVVAEHRGKPVRLTVCHLPFGPTASFTLSNVVMRHDILDVGTMSEAYPHLIFHNFSSKLGDRVRANSRASDVTHPLFAHLTCFLF